MTPQIPIFNSSPANEISWPPDPIRDPASWDKIKVAGVYNPGRASVGQFKRKWIFDEKKGKGQPRAKLTFTGAYLARGVIKFFLMTGPDFNGGTFTDLQDWVGFAELFNYDPTKSTVTAVEIEHPSLQMIKGLRAFVCEEISNPVQVYEGDCLYMIEVALIEWAPDPPQNVAATISKTKATPPASTNPPGSHPVPADIAQREAIIAELLKKQAPP